MRRTAIVVLSGLWLSAAALAQGMNADLGKADRLLQAGQWSAALEVLLPLLEVPGSPYERETLGNMLGAAGDGLIDARDFEAALRALEAAIATDRERLAGADDAALAVGLNNAASCLEELGRPAQALRHYEAALAMRRRLHGDEHSEVAVVLNNLANCHLALGDARSALPLAERSLAMRRMLHGGSDHAEVAASLNTLGQSRLDLGEAEAALDPFEAGLAMRLRLFPGDDAAVASSLNGKACCMQALGQLQQAQPLLQAGLAMRRRLAGDRDHEDVALSLNNVAENLLALGKPHLALAHHEAAVAMRRRLHGDGDHPMVAFSISNLAHCLQNLGRTEDALPLFEAALEMRRRIFGDRNPAVVAMSLNNVANCTQVLGRSNDALRQFEAALSMLQGVYGDRNHSQVAITRNNLGLCLESLGRGAEALPHFEASQTMLLEIYGGRDHPDVVSGLNNIACCRGNLGQADEGLAQLESALAMLRRLHGAADHPLTALILTNVAASLRTLGQLDRALEICESACAMIERLRAGSQVAPALRQSHFDLLKRGNPFERLQVVALAKGQPEVALRAAERARGRELLDVLEQQRFDPLEEAWRRARLRGDEVVAERLRSLQADLEEASLDGDRLLHQLTRLHDRALGDADRDARRSELVAESDRSNQRLRGLLDERARLIADVVPAGRVCGAEQIVASLREGEVFLEFTLTASLGLLYVVSRDAGTQAFSLPEAPATVQTILPRLLLGASGQRAENQRGRDPDAGRNPEASADASSTEMFESLVPKELWPRLRTARRVYLAAHGALHRLPFELLITGVHEGKPVYWLDAGPEIAYVPSGSALCWLRQRGEQASDDATDLDLLAVGDPRLPAAEPEVPERGAYVLAVTEGGEGARVGLQPRDAIIAYDGTALVDDTTLRDLRNQIDAAIEDGKRPNAAIQIEVWRRGETLKLAVSPGRLGIEVGRGRARVAHEAALGTRPERIQRSGDLERIALLPPLRGARAETEAIAAVFTARGHKAERLFAQDATEPAVFGLAAKAKYLHFACHGIAEEFAGRSLSMLVLSQPDSVLPEDDGLLKLEDLLHRWRGRLASCRLVVLSACNTNVGRLHRDEAPQALPIGFLFAGAASVVSSLWAVNDASTRQLMTDFYARLAAGETDRLHAFTAAKKALRAKYAEPYHWAPFLYLGSPQ